MTPLTCGIDFGTSNTLAAVVRGGRVHVCEIDPPNLDPQLLPTLLYFSRYGWSRIGRAATHAYQADPDGRFIRALKSALPDYGPEETFRVFQETYTLPGLLRLVFSRVREQLADACGAAPVEATLGRPVRFSSDPAVDRRAETMLRAAAEEAGFRTVRFLSEPEAATRYYFSSQWSVVSGQWSVGGAGPKAQCPTPNAEPSTHSLGIRPTPRVPGHPTPNADQMVLVFDFGGGTLDLCLARFGREGYSVLNTGGAHIGGTLLDRILFERKLLRHLGHGQRWGRGLDLPNALFNRLVNPDANWRITETEYARESRRILSASAASGTASPQLAAFHTVVSRRLGPDLFSAIEAAKMRLSEVEETEIRFAAPGVEIREPLSRSDLRVLFADQLQAIRILIDSTLAGAGRRLEDVDRVLLAGGSSALICTQELLRDLFGPARVPLRQDLFTSIVSGLALDAASSEDVLHHGETETRSEVRSGKESLSRK